MHDVNITRYRRSNGKVCKPEDLKDSMEKGKQDAHYDKLHKAKDVPESMEKKMLEFEKECKKEEKCTNLFYTLKGYAPT